MTPAHIETLLAAGRKAVREEHKKQDLEAEILFLTHPADRAARHAFVKAILAANDKKPETQDDFC